jgi:hypothetical protein
MILYIMFLKHSAALLLFYIYFHENGNITFYDVIANIPKVACSWLDYESLLVLASSFVYAYLLQLLMNGRLSGRRATGIYTCTEKHSHLNRT